MKKNIWIIDDDMITRFLITRTLSKASFESETREFADGENALEALRTGAKEGEPLPDIVLLDISMPLMDGWDFLRELDNEYIKGIEDVIIMILTSSMDPLDEKKGRANKYIRAFLRKPLNVIEFTRAIGAIDAASSEEGD